MIVKRGIGIAWLVFVAISLLLSAFFVRSVVINTSTTNVTLGTNATVFSGYPGVANQIINFTITNVDIASAYNISVNITTANSIGAIFTVELNDSADPDGWVIPNYTVGKNFRFDTSTLIAGDTSLIFRLNISTPVANSTAWNFTVRLLNDTGVVIYTFEQNQFFYVDGINITTPRLNQSNLSSRTIAYTYYSYFINTSPCTLWINGTDNGTSSGVTNSQRQTSLTIPEAVTGAGSAYQMTLSCLNNLTGENVTTNTLFFDLDATPPSVTATTAAGTVSGNSNVTLQWVATDTLDSNLACVVYQDGIVNATVLQTNLTNLSNVTEGSHTWSVNCTDGINYNQTANRAFIVDLSAPSLTAPTLNDSVIRNNSIVNLTFTYNESTIQYVNISGGNVSSISCPNGTSQTCSALVTLLNQSGNALTVTITDFIERAGSSIVTYEIDDAVPTVTILNSSGVWTSVSPQNLAITGTDNLDTALNCSFFENNSLEGSISVNGLGVFNTTFSEGSRGWNVSCVDDAENSANSTIAIFNVDLTNPAITNLTLNGSVHRNGSLMTLNITYTEANLLFINISGGNFTGQNVSCGTSGTNISCLINLTAPQSSGANNIIVSSVDIVGRSNFTTLSYIVNTSSSAPVINSVSLNDSVIRNNSLVLLAINYSDTNILYVNVSGGNVTSLTGCQNGTDVVCSADISVMNQSGNTLTVSITDFDNQVSTSSVSYSIDDIPPENAVLIDPTGGSFYNYSTHNMTFAVGDNLDQNLNCSIYINDSLVGSILANGSVGSYNTSISEGRKRWNVSCTDDADNTNNTLITNVFTIDLTSPVIAGLELNGSTHRNGTNMTLNITYTEANLYFINITGGNFSASRNLSCVQNGTASCFVNVTAPVGEGTYGINISITDFAQRMTTSSTSYTVTANLAPRIASVTLNDSIIRNNSVVNLTINYNESEILYVNVSGGNVSTISSCPNGTSQSCIALVTVLNQSGNTLTISMTDIDNQMSSSSVSYSIDDSNPLVVALNASSLWSSVATQGMTINATDNLDTGLNCSFYQNNVLNGSISVNGIVQFNTTFTEGSRTWNASCVDDADNVNVTSEILVNVDLTNPSITGTALNGSVFLNGTTMTLALNYTELNIRYVTVSGTNFANQNISCTNGTSQSCSVNLTVPQSVGAQSLNVSVTDFSGRANSSSAISYTVNFTGTPSINLNSPADGASIAETDGNISFNLTVSDDDIATFKVVVDGFINSTYQQEGTGVIVNVTGISAGTHSWYVLANDSNSNNAVSSVRTFVYVINSFNYSQQGGNLNSSLNLTNITFTNSSGGIVTNGSSNQSLNITLNLEGPSVNSSIVFQINASAANWNNSLNVFRVDNISTNATSLRSFLMAVPNFLIMFHRFGSFINESAYNTVSIIINQPLSNKVVFYVSSDIINSSTVRILTQCSSNSAPALVANVSQACYTNSSSNVTLWVPHLSGGGLADDTFVPNISISSPSNGSTQTDGVVNFLLYVNESNPASSFCNVSLVNLSNSISMQNLTLASSDFTQLFNASWSYTTNLSDLLNSTYNLSVTCADTNSNQVTVSSIFNISDTTVPRITNNASGSLTTSGATITWDTHELANESINISGTITADTTSTSTSHSVAVSGLSASTAYTYTIISCDRTGNCNSSVSGTFTTSAAASSGGSSGGGGGGGGSSSGSLPSESTSRIWSSLPVGLANFTPGSSKIAVTEIRFFVITPQTNAQLKVSDLGAGIPAWALAPKDYTVYRYLEIVPTNIPQTAYSQASITFRVDRTWLVQNGISELSVVLLRAVGSSWVPLGTQRISANSSTLTYRADTPGFSTFAIAGKKETTPPVPPPSTTTIPPPPTQPEPKEGPTEPTPPEKEPKQTTPPPISPLVFWIVTGIVVAGIVAAYLFFTKQKDEF